MDYRTNRQPVYNALLKLYFQKLPLTKENIAVTIPYKPTEISQARWWAMLTHVNGIDSINNLEN
jgi:hypothetical protein